MYLIESIIPDEKELEKRIIGELSLEDAYKHVTQLLKTAPRLAGTPAEKKTAEYFKKTLLRYGVSVKIHEFEEFVSYPSNAELKVISPVEKEIVAMVYAHSASTAQNGLKGELVYVGHGAEGDYEKVDVKGKIAFVRFSSAPLYNEKIRIAEKHGAAALILMNWTKPENRLYHIGAAKHVWGNPTLEMLQDLTPESFAHIPCLSITRIDGEYLRELLESQSVCVWMRTKVISEWRKVYEPVATINGSKEPEYFVLMGGHYDAYGSGTTDNATGNALLLELAKILYRNRSHLKRSVRFAWWTGHETAKQAGSTWYLDNNWDDINRHCIAYYNCDSPGMKGTSSYTSYNFAEIRDFQEKNVKDILGEKTESARLSKWADQSFWGSEYHPRGRSRHSLKKTKNNMELSDGGITATLILWTRLISICSPKF